MKKLNVIMKKDKFYVYFHINQIKQEIFYVGKGHGLRAYKKKERNNFWHKVVKKYDFNVIIIHDNISEVEAFELEKKYIKQIGRRNINKGTLVNLTDGGEGASGLIVSEETRKRMSKARKGEKNHNFGKKFPEESIKKMSISSTGKKHSMQTKEKIRKSSTGRKHTLKSIEKMKIICKDRKFKIEDIEKAKKANCRKITDSFENIFNSINETATYYKTTRYIISNMLNGRQNNKLNLKYFNK